MAFTNRAIPWNVQTTTNWDTLAYLVATESKFQLILWSSTKCKTFKYIKLCVKLLPQWGILHQKKFYTNLFSLHCLEQPMPEACSAWPRTFCLRTVGSTTPSGSTWTALKGHCQTVKWQVCLRYLHMYAFVTYKRMPSFTIVCLGYRHTYALVTYICMPSLPTYVCLRLLKYALVTDIRCLHYLDTYTFVTYIRMPSLPTYVCLRCQLTYARNEIDWNLIGTLLFVWNYSKERIYHQYMWVGYPT